MTKCSKTISLFTFIGTPDHEDDSLTALRVSYERFHFDKVVCTVHSLTDNIKKKLFSFCPSAEIHEVGIKTIKEYNQYIVYELNDVIDTEYVLTVQGDGFILNGDKWSPDFLNYDYIGGLWNSEVERRVGNGGFSLRSKKFLEASVRLESDESTWSRVGEDVFLCRENGQLMEDAHGIKYAPVNISKLFAIEHPAVAEHSYIDINSPESYDTFGFHGSVDLHPAIFEKYKNYGYQVGQ